MLVSKKEDALQETNSNFQDEENVLMPIPFDESKESKEYYDLYIENEEKNKTLSETIIELKDNIEKRDTLLVASDKKYQELEEKAIKLELENEEAKTYRFNHEKEKAMVKFKKLEDSIKEILLYANPEEIQHNKWLLSKTIEKGIDKVFGEYGLTLNIK